MMMHLNGWLKYCPTLKAGLESTVYETTDNLDKEIRDSVKYMLTMNAKTNRQLNLKKIEKLFNNYEFDKVLNEIFSFIDSCNEYVQKNKIWETKDKKKLYELKESILKISELLFPFLPETSEKIKKQFSAKKIKKSEILFRKI